MLKTARGAILLAHFSLVGSLSLCASLERLRASGPLHQSCFSWTSMQKEPRLAAASVRREDFSPSTGIVDGVRAATVQEDNKRWGGRGGSGAVERHVAGRVFVVSPNGLFISSDENCLRPFLL